MDLHRFGSIHVTSTLWHAAPACGKPFKTFIQTCLTMKWLLKHESTSFGRVLQV